MLGDIIMNIDFKYVYKFYPLGSYPHDFQILECPTTKFFGDLF